MYVFVYMLLYFYQKRRTLITNWTLQCALYRYNPTNHLSTNEPNYNGSVLGFVCILFECISIGNSLMYSYYNN